MKKRIPLPMAVALMVVAASAAVCGTLLILTLTGVIPKGASAWSSKLNEIQNLVSADYYGDIDENYLSDCIANGYVQGLDDKYAGYYNEEDTNETSMSNSGDKIGIGVTVVSLSDEGQLYVYRVDTEGPAVAAGIQVGDSIVAVDGIAVSDSGTSDAISAIEGDAGTSVRITVLRDGETLDYTVERKEFELTTVYYHMIGTVGYLYITRFNEATPDQLEAAVWEMQQQGVTGLIFDLRYCGGGLVDATAKILDYLLPEGNIISASYADGSSKVLYTSDSSQVELPMAVLTTAHTASAAELFAASVRDYGKGVLIGTTTYGKGVMQRTYNLSDGSSVKFTIAEFAPPSGVSFNGIGLAPDITVELTDEQSSQYYLLNDNDDPHILAALDYFNALQ